MLTALQDVENGFANYRADRQKVDRLASAVSDYANALGLAKDLYARGLTSFLDVLEAEQSLYGNQDLLASAKGQALKDVVTIFKALGRLVNWAGQIIGEPATLRVTRKFINPRPHLRMGEHVA